MNLVSEPGFGSTGRQRAVNELESAVEKPQRAPESPRDGGLELPNSPELKSVDIQIDDAQLGPAETGPACS